MPNGRALPGHFADLAPITVHQKQCHYNRYRREALAASQPPLAPDPVWLNDFILTQADVSVDRAMSMLAALRFICWREGVEDFTADLPARHSLHARRCAERAQQQQLVGLIPSRAVPYCDGYRGAAYSIYTARHFTKNAAQWEVYADAHGMNAEHPSGPELARYFAHHAPRISYGSLNNKRRSLHVYFEDRGLPDVTAAPEVTAVFDGARRQPRPTVKHTSPDELRQAINALGDAPLDKRDRLLLQFWYFGTFDAELLRRIDIENCHPRDEGIRVDVDGHQVLVGGLAEPAFDVVAAYRAWLAVSGLESGRLFRARKQRGGWSKEMSHILPELIVRKAFNRAGIHRPRIFVSARPAFATRSIAAYGVVITAEHMRVEPRSLDAYSAEAARICDTIGGNRRRRAGR